MVEWRFPSNDHGENKGINDSGVATFRGTPLKSLAREICQNSLDASRGDTVRVDFNMFSVPSIDVPGIEVLKDVFNRCLDFWGMQKAKTTKEFFKRAIDVSKEEKCYFLRISDYNTIGLTGTREEINSNWTNLTKSSGASDKKGTAGGSYGIGKYAPFACSDFATVFYSTYNEDGEEAYQGVSRLVTFKREDDETTQGIGYFGNERNTPVFEQLSLEPGFSREKEDYGTDIYIAGYKFANGDWQKDIIISILDGFLGAIWNNKLVINVGDITISKETLQELIEVYKDDLTDYTEYYYQVLVSDDTHWCVENDFLGFGLVKLGILVGDSETPRRIAMIRQTGMKIMDKDRLPGHVPCVGIMFIEGDKINEKLRVIENPEHTLWQPDRASNPIAARELLKSLNRYIKEQIEKLISTGGEDQIDAVGVGAFLPDIAEDDKDKVEDEVVSDKIVEIEVNPSPKKTKSGIEPGNKDLDGESTETDKRMEPGGDEETWFHNGGHTVYPGDKDPQPAHSVDGEGESKKKMKKQVSLKKFIPVCVDRAKGQYMFMLIPNESAKEGIIELFLSAETQNYELPIKSATIIGGGEIIVKNNSISGVEFTQGQTIRLKVEIDYFEICAMEVKAYATSK